MASVKKTESRKAKKQKDRWPNGSHRPNNAHQP
jgi:hypothetical protein